MPVSALIQKVRDDFFAIMAPGFFVLSALMLVYAIIDGVKSPLALTAAISENWQKLWLVYILAFVLMYLIGNLLRAVPVTLVDQLNKLLFSWTAYSKYSKNFYTQPFPYREAMLSMLESVRNAGCDVACKLPYDQEKLHSVYNFYKTVLCAELPENFVYTQGLEARVRLFAGIYWAGVIGLISSVLIISYQQVNSGWKYAAILTLILLGLVLIASGLHLRNVQTKIKDKKELQKLTGRYARVVWFALSVLVFCVGVMCYQQASGEWKIISIIMFIFSMVIIILFGRQLPKIRGQEVEYVFLSYLAYQQRIN